MSVQLKERTQDTSNAMKMETCPRTCYEYN